MGFFDKLSKVFSGSDDDKAPRRTVKTIQVGDFIEYYGDSYEVTQRYEISDDEMTWYEYRLKKSKGEILFLTVEEDDELYLIMTQPVSLSDFELPIPIPKKINYKNVQYALDEHDFAMVKAIGTNGAKKSYKVEYWDYEDNEGEKVFSIERYGEEEYEISYGEYIEESEIEIFPGTGKEE